MDENIESDAPVMIVNALIDGLNLKRLYALYSELGRRAYHPKMMLKAVVFGYMNNVFSCRKIESRLKRDIHFMGKLLLSGSYSGTRSLWSCILSNLNSSSALNEDVTAVGPRVVGIDFFWYVFFYLLGRRSRPIVGSIGPDFIHESCIRGIFFCKVSNPSLICRIWYA